MFLQLLTMVLNAENEHKRAVSNLINNSYVQQDFFFGRKFQEKGKTLHTPAKFDPLVLVEYKF